MMVRRRDVFGRMVVLLLLLLLLGVGRDGAEGRVGVLSQVVAFGEAGFDFEDGVGEEDGFLLEACEDLLSLRHRGMFFSRWVAFFHRWGC